MAHNFLSPLSDLVFKRIFSDTAILAGFLSAVLNLRPGDLGGLTVSDPQLIPDTIDGKLAILDISAKTRDGALFDVEIQVFRVAAIRARILFYNARLIAGQLKSGQRYGRMRPVVSIIISEETVIAEERACHNVYRLMNAESRKVFTKLLEIHTLELGKMTGADADSGRLGEWLKFLTAKTREESMEAAKGEPLLMKAYDVLTELCADERFRAEVEAREKAILDYNSNHDVEGFIEEGIETGIQIGEERLLGLLERGETPEAILRRYGRLP